MKVSNMKIDLLSIPIEIDLQDFYTKMKSRLGDVYYEKVVEGDTMIERVREHKDSKSFEERRFEK